MQVLLPRIIVHTTGKVAGAHRKKGVATCKATRLRGGTDRTNWTKGELRRSSSDARYDVTGWILRPG